MPPGSALYSGSRLRESEGMPARPSLLAVIQSGDEFAGARVLGR